MPGRPGGRPTFGDSGGRNDDQGRREASFALGTGAQHGGGTAATAGRGPLVTEGLAQIMDPLHVTPAAPGRDGLALIGAIVGSFASWRQ